MKMCYQSAHYLVLSTVYYSLWDHLRKHVHDCFLMLRKRKGKEFIHWLAYSTDARFTSGLWSVNLILLPVCM